MGRQMTSYIRRLAAAIALVLSAGGNVQAGINDLRGKEWRSVSETMGVTWDQLAQICPQDGVTPCAGSIGTRNFTGWVWATQPQVLDLFSYYVPEILTNPGSSVGGYEYATVAGQFQTAFGITFQASGCPTYQGCFNIKITHGWTASVDGANVPISGEVTLALDEWSNWVGQFTFRQTAATATGVGTFMWRPTGLDTGKVHANDDVGQPATPMGGVAVNVFANDWIGGERPTAATAALTQTSPALNGIVLYSDGSVTVDPGTLAGSYGLSYQLCAVNNAANCDSADVAITVKSFALTAANDSATLSFKTGGIAVNVLANDTLGGVVATPAVVSLRQLSSSSSGISLNSATGAVAVVPGTPSALHTLTYEVCERANPVNCKQANVTVRPHHIDAVNDYWRISTKTGGTTPSVLANDYFQNAIATTAKVSITLLSPLAKGIAFNTATGQIKITAKDAGGPSSGIYSINYRICESASPDNCDAATVTLELSGKNN